MRDRSLGLFLGARLAATLGVQVQSVAVGWQVYARTGRPIDLGWVGLAQFLPLFTLSLFAGSYVDRHDRRSILAVTRFVYAAGAGALAALALVPEEGLAPIYSVLVVLGATRAFSGPAASALLPRLVAPARLQRAIAMSSTTFQIGTIAGPALGGFIYAAGGAELAYGCAAGFEITGALLVLGLPTLPPHAEVAVESARERLLSGLRFVLRKRTLLGAISLDLVAVLLGGAVALMPIFARDVLVVGERGLGLLRAAPAVGAALMAVLFALRPMARHAGRYMFAGVAVFGLATCVFALSRSFGLSLAALVVLGAADMMSVVVRQSLVQLRTPDAMRGRVAAVNLVFIGASNELGELESGLTAAWLGTVRAAIAGGIGTLVVTGLWATLFPELRRVDRLEVE